MLKRIQRRLYVNSLAMGLILVSASHDANAQDYIATGGVYIPAEAFAPAPMPEVINNYPEALGPYGDFNACQGYYNDTHNCVDFTLEFCAEAQQRGMKCYPVTIYPKEGDGHAIVVLEVSRTSTAVRYCFVEPNDGTIVGQCWDDPITAVAPILNWGGYFEICRYMGYAPRTSEMHIFPDCKAFLDSNP
jgi:hypothetical protein